MNGAARNGLAHRYLLEALVVMGWLNVPALLGFPILFVVLAGGFLHPTQIWWWVASVWFGTALHLVVMVTRSRWWERYSVRSWELTYATVQGLNGCFWSGILLIERLPGDGFAVDMLMLACLMVTSAATVVCFAGSQIAGRAYLSTHWTVFIVVMGAHNSPGMALLGASIWAGALGYHEILFGLLSRTVDAGVRATELADELAVRASVDPLTGLLNRSALSAAVEAAQAAEGSVTILFIDLDGFKDVNDGLGHARGDEVLIEVAQRLRDTVRPGDQVGRLGGDEFVVMLPGGIHESGAAAVAERISDAIARPFEGTPPVYVSASVGIAEGSATLTTDETLSRADLAMYEAKSSGGHAMRYFETEQADRRRDHLTRSRELPFALANSHIIAYAQPIVAIATGQPVGFELLARWAKPDGTLLSPDQFVPLAEDHGLDRHLGCLMLDHATRAAARSPFTFTVNVTPAHLLSGHLHRDLLEALERHGAPPDRVVVEITESQVMTDMARARIEVERIESIGAAVAIDDFGTGSSSLALAERLPCALLKVAPEFALRIETSDRALTVLRSITELADGLGFGVLAEGIETPRAAELVTSVGIRLGQGFLYARPRPLDDVLDDEQPRRRASDTPAEPVSAPPVATSALA